MKTNFKILISSLLLIALSFSACTEKFEEMNIDERSVTEQQLEADYYFIGGFFPQIQQMIYCNFNWGWGTDWTYQIMQNLNADIWSGYMMTPTPFAGNVNNSTYFLMDGWNFSAWDYTYAYFMTTVKQVEDITVEDFPEFNAVVKILKVLGMHRISDQYGPIIYTQYGKAATGGTYDSQKEAYYAFFEDLDYAISTLDTYVQENPDAMPFARYDQFFGGDFNLWIKFANSLRLRLAMRISDIDAAKAKDEAETAMTNSYGVLEANDAAVSGKGYTHPVAAIANSWGDIRLGAPVENILAGYNDPRLPKYATATTDSAALAQGFTYKGIRQGIELIDKAVYLNHSNINISSETPAQLMTAAEVYFLRAEGALKGWANMGGSAQELYEMGIQRSMDQWGVSIGDYLNSDSVPGAYVDVLNDANSLTEDSEYLVKVSPKWDDAASNEVKLEKIITQKWIAMFPEGMEAWSEYRRTGYPTLMPVVINNSGGSIDTEEMVKRLQFSPTERDANPEGYAKAVELLGGPDNGGTALWWDVD